MKSTVRFLLFISIFSTTAANGPHCRCPFKATCTNNPFRKIYPNQNMCLLLDEIPKAIKQLPYVTLPNCQSYNVARFNYNKRFDIFPHAIIVPRTAHEVAHALALLRHHKLHFSLRSCGHCYGPGSLSSDYVIDLRHFNEIKPNLKNDTVYIGVATHLSEVIETLGKLDYALPTGTCPSVGAGGLALGGGIGILGRQFGLTCDSIKSITFVNAKSEIIEVDKQHYPDLFFGLRGAGNGSYGIVLGITFTMHYIPRVTFLELAWDWDPAVIPSIIEAWQSWITTLKDTISTEIHIRFVDGKAQFSIVGLKLGTKPFTEWEKTFKHFKPHVTIKNERYLKAARKLAGSYTEPFSKAKSKFLMEPLPAQGIAVIVDYIDQLIHKQEDFLVYFELGAARGKFTKGNTAYFPRHALMWFFQFIYWNFQHQSSKALNSINEFYENISPFCSRYSYANLVDYDLDKHYLRDYYGNKVKKLIRIKDKYDPKNIFHWKQSIPTSFSR